jgi:hypothetical protein
VHPDLWPSPDVAFIHLAACLGSASHLKGEQIIHLPCLGSELHAVPTTPQYSSSLSSPPPLPTVLSPPLDTLTHENPLGERAASEWRTTNLCPECWKLDPLVETLEKSGGTSASDDSPILLGNPGAPDPFGLAGVAENTGVGDVEPSSINAHERGGALPVGPLHQPWPRELPASNPLAGLKKPPPPSPRR